jgi:hypothetical protein
MLRGQQDESIYGGSRTRRRRIKRARTILEIDSIFDNGESNIGVRRVASRRLLSTRATRAVLILLIFLASVPPSEVTARSDFE